MAIRLAVVMTHPVQYFAPWFRHLAARHPELELTVLYATEPTAAQQGAGFGRPFRWDLPLTDGYRARIVRPPRFGRRIIAFPTSIRILREESWQPSCRTMKCRETP